MFNLKLMTALRLVVFTVPLFAVSTTQSAPAGDTHVALPETPFAAAASPNPAPVCAAPAAEGPVAGQDRGVACFASCDRARESCEGACEGDKWCVMGCTVTHAFCIYACNMGGMG